MSHAVVVEEKLHFGILRLDFCTRRFSIGDIFVPLRNKEFTLLFYFLRNAGRVISRTEILEQVWDQNIFCSTNTVDVHVSALRRKLKKHFGFALIKTVHCVGYIFEH